MAAMHPQLFQKSTTDESEIRKLVVNYFLLDHTMLQLHPTTGEDILTPNTTRLSCFPLSSNADSASRPVTFSADSLITIRLN
jgi:hypothetical protein